MSLGTHHSLQQARNHLLEHGTCPPGALDERLAQSWQRSLHAGLRPLGSEDMADPVSSAHLQEMLHGNAELLAHARPVMDFLYGQIRGNHSMVVLADAQCTLLHTQGDRAFLNKAQRVALSRGASWHEAQRGTNAIGTAMAERMPLRVRGGEHFLEQNRFLHCSAAPIFSAQGEVAGIIDISGDQYASQSHALGLASTAARMIENSWLKARYPHLPRIHMHAQAEGLDTLAEGILVMTEDGFLVGANQEAMRLLRLRPADFFALRLEDRLQQRLGQLLRQPGEAPQALRLPNGRRLYLQIHHRPRASGTSAAATAPTTHAGPRSQAHLPAHSPADPLAALDTGDLQWRAATHKVRRILSKPIALLIQGESGVGKEVFARAAHDSGPRRGHPFIAINCAAIPEALIEAELFGYAPGAYTGAQKGGSPGRIREAHGGTLFLDEIGDMPLALQTRLLRVLQERSVTPLGGSSVAVDFALISATHCPLDEAVEQGRFRRDLYYRINGFSVHLPPLRARSDFDALVERLLQQFGAPAGVGLGASLHQALRRHDWPGNLRQLASTLQTACALLEAHETHIDWHHLADDIAHRLRHGVALLQAGGPAPARASSAGMPDAAMPARSLRSLSRSAVLQALQQCSGNISQAARQLGISRQTVYRHLRAVS